MKEVVETSEAVEYDIEEAMDHRGDGANTEIFDAEHL